MRKQYVVELSREERTTLEQLTRRGTHPARVVKRAQMLLLSADGQTDEAIAGLLRVSPMTVRDARVRWVAERLSRGLADKPRPGGQRQGGRGRLTCLNTEDRHGQVHHQRSDAPGR